MATVDPILRLKKNFRLETQQSTRIQVSSKVELSELPSNRLGIKIKPMGVGANMQDYSSAFEGWALPFIRFGKYDGIVIDWDLPSNEVRRSPHYQRFLYRVKSFASRYSWFSLSDIASMAISDLLVKEERGPYILNTRRSKGKKPDIVQVDLFKCTENQVEWWFHESPPNSLLRDLRLDSLYRQLPVGLFHDEVTSRDNQPIFTGKGSALDLWGLSGDTCIIFKLKKHDNRKVGVISELFFYSMVVKDIINKNFVFEKPISETLVNEAGDPSQIQKCNRLRAFILAPELHPLLDDQGIFNELNSATPTSPDDLEIRYGYISYDCTGNTELRYS